MREFAGSRVKVRGSDLARSRQAHGTCTATSMQSTWLSAGVNQSQPETLDLSGKSMPGVGQPTVVPDRRGSQAIGGAANQQTNGVRRFTTVLRMAIATYLTGDDKYAALAGTATDFHDRCRGKEIASMISADLSILTSN